MNNMRIALVGNPNVGKSVIFNRLTGIGVISSNYPGTTVELTEGKVSCGNRTFKIYDLPGIYSLGGITEDEKVTLQFLVENRPDCVVAVADATRLEQSLVLIFQLIELGFKTLVALNFMDIAKMRYQIDVEKLSTILGIPVVPTVGITGEGVDRILHLAASDDVKPSNFRVNYDWHIEELLKELSEMLDMELGFPTRGAILKLLEGSEYFRKLFPDQVIARADSLKEKFREQHGETIEVHIARDRYGEAGKIVNEVIRKIAYRPTLREKLSHYTIQPITGVPILICVLVSIFLSVIYIGGFLEEVILDGYQSLTGNFFQELAAFIGGKTGEALSTGIDLSLQAILAIVVPYILVFYLILGILEDSGYLPRVVVMLDGLMHKIGLHGRAIIPMIVGLGCNVPAILATRVIESRRERLILATITIVAIPCSAQTVIIIGTVGNYSGIEYALSIYLFLLILALILGKILNKLISFEPSSLAIEIPDLSLPLVKNILKKTWMRVSEFFVIAFPLLLAGSIVLEFLMVFDVLNALVDPLSPLTMGMLGLPAITIIALIFGVLRKEMALQLLVVLFGTTNLASVLSPEQMFVFAIVMATYMPCIAAFAVIRREFGWKDAIKISIASITIAILLGTIFNFLLHAL